MSLRSGGKLKRSKGIQASANKDSPLTGSKLHGSNQKKGRSYACPTQRYCIYQPPSKVQIGSKGIQASANKDSPLTGSKLHGSNQKKGRSYACPTQRYCIYQPPSKVQDRKS